MVEYTRHLLATDAFERIEEQFNRDLDESLSPRGPEMLYDIVGGLGLPGGARVLDAGCGGGSHARELAQRFGLNVLGVDPGSRLLEGASSDGAEDGSAAGRVSFAAAIVEALPVRNASVDLVWCRDVLELAGELQAAYGELRRVLRPRGRALVYQMFATDRLEAREMAWACSGMGCPEENLRPDYAEAVMKAAGLRIEERIILGTEWGEYSQERTGSAGRKLLHAGRLLRDPERYIRKYGRTNYDIALADCLWHVYRLIGKLSYRIYLLSASS